MTLEKYPKISIVTPSFNQGEFLEDTIQSVLSQNYPNLEYIIIDGGSTDQSLDIIKKYSDQLAYWISEPDKGHADALNKGFKHSTGEIMAWLNSDDKYFSWTFSVISEIFNTFPHLEWLASETKVMLNSQGLACQRQIFLNFGRQGFKKGLYLPDSTNCIPQESVFWRRSLWDKAGGYIDENLPIVPDFELWSRFWKQAELYTVPTPLGAIRIHKKQITTSKFDICCREAKKIWKKQGGHFSLLPQKFFQQTLLRIPLLCYVLVNKRRIIRYDHEAIRWYSWQANSRLFRYFIKIIRRIIRLI